jgi:tripartite-type tricarboxylate transporter receptor subunit TctC
MGQPVTIDNRAGANGMIGSEAVAKSVPDGYTILVDNVTGHAINATLQAKMPFDSMRDFAHVSLLAQVPDGVVSLPSLPAKDVRELIALAKSQQRAPRRRTVQGHGGHRPAARALQGRRAGDHRLARRAGLHLYPRAALGGAASQGGQAAPACRHRREALGRDARCADRGRIRPARLRGPQLVRPHDARRHARDVVSRLNAEAVKAISAPDVRDKLAALGFETQTSTPQGLQALLKSETEKWAKVLKASGAKAD